MKIRDDKGAGENRVNRETDLSAAVTVTSKSIHPKSNEHHITRDSDSQQKRSTSPMIGGHLYGRGALKCIQLVKKRDIFLFLSYFCCKREMISFSP